MARNNILKKSVEAFFAICGMLSICLAASPLATIPWNGYAGAVSFTFDDALENQAENLKPILDEMPDVQATFFITGVSYYFSTEFGARNFASLADAGHEIGNHSLTHGEFAGMAIGSPLLNEEIVNYADILERRFSHESNDLNITSFATPYGINDTAITYAISQRHFINRDCIGKDYRRAWNQQPEWYKIPALVWTRSNKKVEDVFAALDSSSAKNSPQREWMVVVNHGVASDDNDLSINPEDIKRIIQHARDNRMWVAGMSTVGAYFKAHFTLDTATAKSANGSYKVRWEMPHPNMPKSIPLKVKLNKEFLQEAFEDTVIFKGNKTPNYVLEQNGNVIWPDENGIYTIEFSELDLNIRKATANDIKSRPQQNTIGLNSFSQEAYSIFDVNGKKRGSGSELDIPTDLPRGTYLVRGKNRKNVMLSTF